LNIFKAFRLGPFRLKPAKIALAFRRTFGELENRIKLFIVIYERERAKKAVAGHALNEGAFEQRRAGDHSSADVPEPYLAI
jgi:hypothetical protein